MAQARWPVQTETEAATLLRLSLAARPARDATLPRLLEKLSKATCCTSDTPPTLPPVKVEHHDIPNSSTSLTTSDLAKQPFDIVTVAGGQVLESVDTYSARSEDAVSVHGADAALVRQIQAQRAALLFLARNLPVSDAVIHDAMGIQESDDDPEFGDELWAPNSGMDVQAFFDLKRSRTELPKELRLRELGDIPVELPPEIRCKAVIEQKGLSAQIRELQRKLRAEVHMEGSIRAHMRTNTLHDWQKHKRRKEPPMRGLTGGVWLGSPLTSLFVPNLPDPQRDACVDVASLRQAKIKAAHDQKIAEAARRKRAEREKRQTVIEARLHILSQRREFISRLLVSRVDMRSNATQAVRNRKQRNEAVVSFHNKLRARVVREERQRIQMLKSGDTAKYLEMLDSAKNDRLKELLKKTDDLLNSLGQKVAQQRREGREARGDGEEEEEQGASALSPGTTKQMALDGQKRYNDAVHRLKEVEVEQPSCMKAGELRDYQLEGLKWMASLYSNNLNGILADEMGLGKTIQTIALLAYLLEKKDVKGPHIILAPKPVLANWEKEFKKWMPTEMVVLTYDGKPEDRKLIRDEYLVNNNFNVLLTHYDYVMKDKAYLGRVPWKYIVVDEGHRLKNDKSRLAETLRTCYDFKHRLLITGTPINNNLQELWALLNFILPNIFNSADSFDEWFAKPFQGMNSGSGDDEVLSEEEVQLIIHRLHNVLRPFLLRRKKDEVETGLPEKTDFVIFCDLSAWQKLYYQQVIMKRNVHNKSLNNTAMQLRKICNHPYLLMDEEDDLLTAEDRLRASGKFFMLARLLEKLKATGHRVLLFSQMVKALDIVQDFLEDSSYSFLRLDGKTKPEERVGQVDAWNEDDSPYFIFILSTRAGGLGLNLQTADTVIILDSDWNPQQDLQAECRAHRIGQTKPVRVLTLASKGTIDEWILKRAGEKKLIDNKVIQAGMFNNQSSMEDRQELLQDIMQEGMQLNLTSEDLPTDDEVNQAVARSDEEFLLFQQMDLDLDKSLAQRSMERLMQHKEIPRVVTEDVEKEEELELEQNTIEGILGTEEFGRGKRRAAVNYSEEETKGSRKRDRNEQDEADDAPRRVSRRPRKHIKAGDS